MRFNQQKSANASFRNNRNVLKFRIVRFPVWTVSSLDTISSYHLLLLQDEGVSSLVGLELDSKIWNIFLVLRNDGMRGQELKFLLLLAVTTLSVDS